MTTIFSRRFAENYLSTMAFIGLSYWIITDLSDFHRSILQSSWELRPLGININALRPGAVRTEHTTQEFGADFDWSGWAEPEDVGPPVGYLAGQIGTDFTGRVLDVSGFGKTWGV